MTLAAHCGSETRELSPGDDLRACPRCGELFTLDPRGLTPLAMPAGTRARARWIAGVEARTYRSPGSPGSFELTVERFWFQRFLLWGIWGLVLGMMPMTFGVAFAGTGLGLMRGHLNTSPAQSVAIGLVALGIAVGMLYVGLADLINRTRLTISASSVVVRDLPLRWRSTISLQRSYGTTARSVGVRKNDARFLFVFWPRPVSYEVHLVPPEGAPVMLFDFLNETASTLLAASIARLLQASTRVAPG